MNNQKRPNPVVDRLSDLVYLTAPDELEAAILSEGHTEAELSEALPDFIEEFERSIRKVTAEISLLDSERVEMCARLRVLLSVKKKAETKDWVD